MNIHALSNSKKELLAKLAEGKLRIDKIPKKPASQFAPLSFSQQRLWFLEQLVPGSSVYNMHDAVRIRGAIDPQLLQKALSRIVQRHESLRTTFTRKDGEPMQMIQTSREVDLPIESVSDEQRAEEIAREETIRPFDLETGPLFRVRLIRLNKEDHILLWTMHHIISDGWSLGLIIKEVTTLLQAYSQNLPDPLPPLSIQYSDFSVWQKEWLRGAILDKQIAYWKEELAGDFPPLTLPIDYPRPAMLSNKGARKLVSYPAELIEKLTQVSTQEEATLFMVLLAAWKLLLHRYSDADTIFIGVPVANRNRVELSDLIGFFANTLVIRSELHSDLPFLDLLAQIKKKSLAAYQHQDIPFERLIEILQPKRELNTSAFFQVMFVLQNQPIPKVDEPGLKIEPMEIHNGTCKFDLLLNIYENQVGIEYNAELFSEHTIEAMLHHYQAVLETIAANPNLSVGEVSFLSKGQLRKMLFDWNQTEVDFSFSKTLSQYVEEQVAKTPSKIAVTDERLSLSYEQLNRRANLLAHELIDKGVKPNVVVGVYMPRSVEQVISLLAILKAGGAYLPLDTEYPEERVSFMIEDSKTPLLLYNRELPSWISKLPLHTIDTSVSPANGIISNPLCTAQPISLAYVIYTSGSTGKPNGAMIPHRGICNRLLWMQQEYQLTPDDRVLQKTSCSFDVSVWEFFWPLITGAELIIAAPGIHRDPALLACCIQQYKVTTLHFVPSMLMLFLSQVSHCPSLRLVFCSGEALSYELANHFKKNSHAQLHNLYGPTEVSIDVTFWDCSKKTQKQVIPIGRPIANTQIYILDSQMQPVPIGVSGELYIGGVGVGLGYLNREELTRKKFIPNPFLPGQTLYKTGDLARYWQNGEIEFLGRVDDQVKMRGVRIELGEIEQALLEYPGIQSATVAAHDQTLTAYVVSSNTRSQEQERIHHWQTVFDTTYSANHPTPAMGWNSSYTGNAYSEEAMQEWVDEKIEKILKLKPKKILEIGCGTGMLLFRLAMHTDLYIGTDISSKALSFISNAIPATSINQKSVRLFQCAAPDFSPFENETFDLVILNSIVQYFPSIEYLFDVLNKAASLLTSSGSIFLGDLRNLALMDLFYQSVILENAKETMTVAELQKQVGHKKNQERELFIDPALFKHIPQVQAEVFLQHSTHKTEMFLFRYNAILSTHSPTLSMQTEGLQHFTNRPIDLREQASALKSYLLKKLPEYMVPSHVLFLDHFPLSPNGKIAKKLLPLPTVKSASPPPSTACQPLEQEIIKTWSEVLGLSSIGKTDHFFDLGGHSLSAAQAVLKLSDRLGKEIPLRLLFQFPTVEEFASSIESQQNINQRSITWAKMLQDSFLHASITAKEPSLQNPTNIFLTGATGFLGVYLLRDLLFHTSNTVHCLVRAQNALEGLMRLRKNLAYYRLTDEIDCDRIIVVPGDLDQPHFGLSEEQYQFYAQNMGSIYHCAAQVNFADSYNALRASNVLGTVEILRLAVTGHTKPVHYISTLHVLTREDQGSSSALTESEYPRHGEALEMGYLQSKWVAEKLMLAAKERNISVNIYRVGRVGGDTQSGACQQNDFYWGLVRACIKMGKIPGSDFAEQIIPVDIASRAITRLSIDPNEKNQTFHILNPDPLESETLIACAREKGYHLSSCTMDEWKQIIFEHLKKDPNDPAAALAGFLSNRWGEQEPTVSARLTLQKMKKSGVVIPDTPTEWIKKTIEFFMHNYFLPRPI